MRFHKQCRWFLGSYYFTFVSSKGRHYDQIYESNHSRDWFWVQFENWFLSAVTSPWNVSKVLNFKLHSRPERSNRTWSSSSLSTIVKFHDILHPTQSMRYLQQMVWSTSNEIQFILSRFSSGLEPSNPACGKAVYSDICFFVSLTLFVSYLYCLMFGGNCNTQIFGKIQPHRCFRKLWKKFQSFLPLGFPKHSS